MASLGSGKEVVVTPGRGEPPTSESGGEDIPVTPKLRKDANNVEAKAGRPRAPFPTLALATLL